PPPDQDLGHRPGGRGGRGPDQTADACGYRARAEQVILFTVTAWDANCPQHIPQRFDAADVAKALASRDARIAALKREVADLKAAPGITG
ncbi:MAG: hypothetical protein ORN49_02565, partial [Rhodobacteraceae bacterium]|nr:hypothetical protein [Paracoccaceae bacterium]